MIEPDPTWLQIDEAAQLRALAGTVLSIGLILSVVVIALSLVLWGFHRAGLCRIGDEAVAKLGTAALASVLLGSLSGIVGWSSGLIIV